MRRASESHEDPRRASVASDGGDRSKLSLLERIAAICMVSLTVLFSVVIVRGFFADSTAGKPAPAFAQEEKWKELIDQGPRIGSGHAPIQLVEFGDFECPACGRLHSTLERLRGKFGDSLAITFVHFPLDYHKSALKAATIAECASILGRFDDAHNLLFKLQDSLLAVTPSDVAARLRIDSASTFLTCASRTDSLPRIRNGLSLGKRFQLKGTPTVIVNGIRFRDVPTEHQLDSIFTAQLQVRTGER